MLSTVCSNVWKRAAIIVFTYICIYCQPFWFHVRFEFAYFTDARVHANSKRTWMFSSLSSITSRWLNELCFSSAPASRNLLVIAVDARIYYCSSSFSYLWTLITSTAQHSTLSTPYTVCIRLNTDSKGIWINLVNYYFNTQEGYERKDRTQTISFIPETWRLALSCISYWPPN